MAGPLAQEVDAGGTAAAHQRRGEGPGDNQRRTLHIFFHSIKIFSDNTRGRAHYHMQEQ